MCDAGGPNQLSETIVNLGLWTRLGIPTTGTIIKIFINMDNSFISIGTRNFATVICCCMI